jgi:hypothetical protein
VRPKNPCRKAKLCHWLVIQNECGFFRPLAFRLNHELAQFFRRTNGLPSRLFLGLGDFVQLRKVSIRVGGKFTRQLIFDPPDFFENSDEPTPEPTDKPNEPKTPREPREKQQPGGFAANCKFETASMGEAGVIYEAEQQGRTIIIRWNSDHPFYKRFVLENQQDKGMLAAADYLVYSLACAELLSLNDDNVELIQTFKATMSANLRTLLS